MLRSRLLKVIAAPILLVAAYAAAGLVGGAIPVNRDWREPAAGVRIWVASNGWHTDIVVPKVAAGIDWRPMLQPRHLRDPRYAGYDHASFGWGEERFYLETPGWRDLRPATVIAAAAGSDRTLVHAGHLPAPITGPEVRAILLTPDQYRRLARFLRASVAARPVVRHGYGAYDAFYQGRGHYDAVATCNAWTGDALRHAGVRMGAWTPFPVTVMWWL